MKLNQKLALAALLTFSLSNLAFAQPAGGPPNNNTPAAKFSSVVSNAYTFTNGVRTLFLGDTLGSANYVATIRNTANLGGGLFINGVNRLINLSMDKCSAAAADCENSVSAMGINLISENNHKDSIGIRSVMNAAGHAFFGISKSGSNGRAAILRTENSSARVDIAAVNDNLDTDSVRSGYAVSASVSNSAGYENLIAGIFKKGTKVVELGNKDFALHTKGGKAMIDNSATGSVNTLTSSDSNVGLQVNTVNNVSSIGAAIDAQAGGLAVRTQNGYALALGSINGDGAISLAKNTGITSMGGLNGVISAGNVNGAIFANIQGTGNDVSLVNQVNLATDFWGVHSKKGILVDTISNESGTFPSFEELLQNPNTDFITKAPLFEGINPVINTIMPGVGNSIIPGMGMGSGPATIGFKFVNKAFAQTPLFNFPGNYIMPGATTKKRNVMVLENNVISTSSCNGYSCTNPQKSELTLDATQINVTGKLNVNGKTLATSTTNSTKTRGTGTSITCDAGSYVSGIGTDATGRVASVRCTKLFE